MTVQGFVRAPAGAASDAAGPSAASRARDRERTLRVELTVDAPGSAVWDAWSTAAGVQAFLAPKATVERRIGGAYEVFLNPADKRSSTQGCKLLSYLPPEMISFEWRLPADEFPELAAAATWMVVQMHPAGIERTEVRITQLGWGAGPVWNRAYSHMQLFWQMAAARLWQRFERGPLDWGGLRQMWQDAQNLFSHQRTFGSCTIET